MTAFPDMREDAGLFRRPPQHGRVADELDDLVQRHHAGGTVRARYLEQPETPVAIKRAVRIELHGTSMRIDDAAAGTKA